MSSTATAKYTDLLVVGAGFAGIGLGAMLNARGFDDFVILERGLSVGGTWRENTYPGVACDIPSQVYSYSFHLNPDWSRVFPQGPEIQNYLWQVADAHGVTEHIRFGTDVERMRWDEGADRWVCQTSTGIYVARVLVLACGRLSEPKFPPVRNLESFGQGGPQRVVMHSAQWRHDVDLADKRVVVVGSGASAIQIVPEIAAIAKTLTVMQRSAPYVVPRIDRAYSDAERRMFRRVPETMTQHREAWFWQQETVFAQRALVAFEVDVARSRALAHLRAQVQDSELRDRLTPGYEIGCKRVLLSDSYYPTFSQPNVSLIDSALSSVAPGRLTATDGRSAEADIVVLATGFRSARQPYAQRVEGEHGVLLAHEWRDGMYAFASASVPGFPNMFVINGPNAGLGHNSAIVMIESQIEYVCQALAYMSEAGVAVLRVDRAAAQNYRSMIDEMSADTVWHRGGCESWYRDPANGRLTLLWPGSTMKFREVAGRFSPDAYVVEGCSASAPVLGPQGDTQLLGWATARASAV